MRKKIITAGIVAMLGLVGYAGNGGNYKLTKLNKCVGKSIQYEYKDNYYCASDENFNDDKGKFKQRLINNRLKGDDDLGLGQLFIIHNEQARDEIAQIFKDKYDPIKKSFDGSKFNSDVLDQSFLLIEIANMKCNGKCIIDDKNLTESIYNLISK